MLPLPQPARATPPHSSGDEHASGDHDFGDEGLQLKAVPAFSSRRPGFAGSGAVTSMTKGSRVHSRLAPERAVLLLGRCASAWSTSEVGATQLRGPYWQRTQDPWAQQPRHTVRRCKTHTRHAGGSKGSKGSKEDCAQVLRQPFSCPAQRAGF